MIDRNNDELSLRHQCTLLTVNRSGIYYQGEPRIADTITIMNLIYDHWLSKPFYGYRRITEVLKRQGVLINRKRVQRLMRAMGIKGLARTPKTSKGNQAHKKYPYLLRDLEIERCNQAWMVDITYMRLGQGFMYLCAFIDVHSRYIVGWSLSNTLETENCLVALNSALENNGKPEIINSDQGCQFTSEQWIKALTDKGIQLSMTGKGRCHDNIYIERFWRSIKHEEIYLNDYDSVAELKTAIRQYIEFYNTERPHQALDYKTPAELYFAGEEPSMDMCTNLFAKSSQILHTYPQAQQL